jgi:hypothetical protein
VEGYEEHFEHFEGGWSVGFETYTKDADLARRRWVTANPCKLVDAPVVPPSSEVRFLTQEDLVAVVDRGVEESKFAH